MQLRTVPTELESCVSIGDLSVVKITGAKKSLQSHQRSSAVSKARFSGASLCQAVLYWWQCAGKNRRTLMDSWQCTVGPRCHRRTAVSPQRRGTDPSKVRGFYPASFRARERDLHLIPSGPCWFICYNVLVACTRTLFEAALKTRRCLFNPAAS